MIPYPNIYPKHEQLARSLVIAIRCIVNIFNLHEYNEFNFKRFTFEAKLSCSSNTSETLAAQISTEESNKELALRPAAH